MIRPDAVTDFGQFAGLRAEARAQTPEALTKTAKQFEALMLQQMLKSMRAASSGEDVLGGGQTGLYQDMFDQQLASTLSAGKGIGIADVLVKQLRMSQGLSSDAAAEGVTAPAMEAAAKGLRYLNGSIASASRSAGDKGWGEGLSLKPAEALSDPASVTRVSGATSAESRGKADAADFRPQSPQEFIETLLPHAEKAAKKLGIPARVLVAQAALETGWGRHQIRNADGSPSYNLFGIKANAAWSGDRVTTQTSEFENGRFEKQSADFRAYGSIAEAFDDYAHFLQSNPRYGDALRHQGSAHQFVSGLQKAGYATDPGYASKILRIADGGRMQTAMAHLAASGTMTA